MSQVWFVSDLHLGHNRIIDFSGPLRDGTNVVEHDHLLVQEWNRVVSKRDLVFVLGDVCMHKDLGILSELRGNKRLVRGNHDNKNVREYLPYFEDIFGIIKYKGFWVSHAPIHPDELRGKCNIHGHVHGSSIRDAFHQHDKRYFNVCWESYKSLVPFEDIKSGVFWNKTRC